MPVEMIVSMLASVADVTGRLPVFALPLQGYKPEMKYAGQTGGIQIVP